MTRAANGQAIQRQLRARGSLFGLALWSGPDRATPGDFIEVNQDLDTLTGEFRNSLSLRVYRARKTSDRSSQALPKGSEADYLLGPEGGRRSKVRRSPCQSLRSRAGELICPPSPQHLRRAGVSSPSASARLCERDVQEFDVSRAEVDRPPACSSQAACQLPVVPRR